MLYFISSLKTSYNILPANISLSVYIFIVFSDISEFLGDKYYLNTFFGVELQPVCSVYIKSRLISKLPESIF